jgi:uncharacterized membrane protein
VTIKDLMDGISTVFELAGVACIVIGFGVALVLAAARLQAKGRREAYSALRRTFGHSILLGLEILIAADLIRTVAVEPSLNNLAVLGALVVIRTFLAWTLEVEIDGRWPWQRCRDEE